MTEFHWAAKAKHASSKICAFGPKWRNIWNIAGNLWDFLIKISMENWLFSQFSTKYFFDFCQLSEIIYLWKLRPDFYNNSSDFGRGRSHVPPPTLLRSVSSWREDPHRTVLKVSLKIELRNRKPSDRLHA